jgi:hypothetical protein
MTEHEVFEARLRSAMGRYVADGPSDFDALEFARAVAAAEPRHRRPTVWPRWPAVLAPGFGWLLLAAALLVAALVGSALIGSRPTPEPSSWQRVNLPASQGGPPILNEIAQDASRYVAVGEGGYLTPGFVWTSADGLSWDEVQTGSTFATAVLRAVVRTDDGYVVAGAGWEGSASGGGAAIWRSTDGLEWRPAVSIESAEHADVIERLAFANGRFVALGRQIMGSAAGQPMIWVSDDADHWEWVTGVATTDMGSVGRVVAGGPGFVAIGSAGVWTSADGDAWSRALMPASYASGAWSAKLAGGRDGRIVIAGAGGQLYVSDDGDAWMAHELPADGSDRAPRILNLAATSWGYAALTASMAPIDDTLRRSSTLLWTSRDGTTWMPHDLPMAVDPGTVAGARLFVAGDTLITWTATSNGVWALPGAVSPDVIP